MFFILCHLDKTGNLNRLWRKEGVFIIPIHTLLVFIIEDAATLSRALLCHKSQPQGTAIHSTQVAGLFCWNAFFSVFLGHLVVSNGNNLIQLKKKKSSFLMWWQFCDICLTSSFDHELKLGPRKPQNTFLYCAASTETGGLTLYLVRTILWYS